MVQAIRQLSEAARIGLLFRSARLQIGLFLLFASAAHATTYSSLVIPQNVNVQIGSPSENLLLAMQSDGNLVLYSNGTALWATYTQGQNCGTNQCRAVFQADGNLVVYNGSTALWNSGTWGNTGAQLVLSDQLPHMEIVSASQWILWANVYTFSAGNLQLQQGDEVNLGGASLIMQGDGNLVLYQGGSPLWSSGTAGQNCGTNQCHAVFQWDGNFVIYNGSTAIWSSGTAGNTGAQLVLSAQLGEPEIAGTLMPAYPAKEYVYLNGQIVAVENN